MYSILETPVAKGKAHGFGYRGFYGITLGNQILPAMRKVILPLFLAALPVFAFASGPAKMLVVVHSTDRVIYEYVCNNNQGAGAEVPVFRTEVRSQGGFSWHVVGGVAPYRVIRNEENTVKGCITVMDAEGQIATGCSMIGLQRTRVAVDCQGLKQIDDGPYGLAPNDSTDAAHAKWKGETPPSPNVVDVFKPLDKPTPPATGGDRPDDSYHPPVKTPSPDGPPPVDPKPEVVRDRTPFKDMPHTSPRPKPQPHITNTNPRLPSVAPAPSRSPGNTGTSPRPTNPPVQPTPKTHSTR